MFQEPINITSVIFLRYSTIAMIFFLYVFWMFRDYLNGIAKYLPLIFSMAFGIWSLFLSFSLHEG
ncbi:hypothetical protein SAMN03159294_0038 [Kosakonia radicincitans]|nr:hypothetical protein SAMN03159294_0038 [Kosakonia radicincitans]